MPEAPDGNARARERTPELIARSQLLLQYLLAFEQTLDVSEASCGEEGGAIRARSEGTFTDYIPARESVRASG